MKAIDRIKQYIDFKGLNNSNFEKEIGLSNGYIGTQLKREADLGEGILIRILDNCLDLDPEWLLTGNGEMIKTKSNKNLTLLSSKIKGKKKGKKPNVKISSPFKEDPINGIPLIPIDAMAGFGTGEMTVMEYEVSRYVVPEFEELHVEFMIRVKGSSMQPKYSSGDLVACKRLILNDIFFQWNKVYVLDTEQGALIKRVKKGKDQSHILLVSDNAAYDPFELSIEKVRAIAIVLGVIRLE